MAYTIKQIAVSKLLLDQSNPRLRDEQANQQATYLALASLVGEQIINIAEDIVDNGLDPTTLSAVVQDPANKRRYKVLEGNRRLLAIKALESPAIIDSALTPARRKRLSDASRVYAEAPISTIRCVVFESADDAWYWIELRHTGENGGVGLVRWGADEQDRFRSRHGRSASRNPAGQILDFVDAVSPPEDGANSKILTNLQRLVSTKYVRDKLGIETTLGVVYSMFPANQVIRGLSKAVGDLRSNKIRVGDIYYEDNRIEYIDGVAIEDLPDPETRLASPIELAQLTVDFDTSGENMGGSADSSNPEHDPSRSTPTGAGAMAAGTATGQTGTNQSDSGAADGQGAGAGGGGSTQGATPVASPSASRSRARPRSERETVIPRGLALFIKDARINVIYDELRALQVDTFSNACAVLLRVFVELSIDSYIAKHSLMNEQERYNTSLAKRLKAVASSLQQAGDIDIQLEKAVIKIADGTGPLGTSTTTMNQYVHNQYVFPRPTELRTAWDELEPVLQQVWKR